MKKHFILIIIAMVIPFISFADTYSSLWKRVDVADSKDLPKDKLSALNAICGKALNDKEWGHLIKAELDIISTQAMLTPDSLKTFVTKLENKAVAAEKVDPILTAVYNTCLGVIYRDWNLDSNNNIEDDKAKGEEYFDKALKNIQLLADSKARDYEPLLVKGEASYTFNNDLLHVLAFEAKRYADAHKWYEEHGNRPAACLSAFYQTQKDRLEDVREVRKSKYLATLDSLMNVYRDLPEAGEIAIEHFNFLDQATDASAQKKIEYIDYALRMWAAWPRMAILKNARARITLPSFNVLLPETMVIPNRQIPVYITSIVNIQNLHVKVTKVNMTGADTFSPTDPDDLKMIQNLMAENPIFEDEHVYYGMPDYKEIRDTLIIKPLELGTYIVEFSTDNNKVPVERVMLHVTNLRLLDMDMPNKQVRLIAVDATTGKPVEGAKIEIKFREWRAGRWHDSMETLVTERNGEVTFSSTLTPDEIRVTTREDQAMQWTGISTMWSKPFNKRKQTELRGNIYTDRAIYRPGQKVNATVVVYDNGMYNGLNHAKGGLDVGFEITDYEGNTVGTFKNKTDEWGVANVEFKLPEVVDRTGYFNIHVTGNEGKKQLDAYKNIRVEEYKRPTFTVSIDEYKKAYKAGDTITVIGHAKTYSGVPVQGAKITYRSSSSIAYWWRSFYHGDEMGDSEELNQETMTNADGSFEMRVPIVKPEGGSRRNICFYTVNINADVTSLAGETRSGNMSLPFGDKSTAVVIDGLTGKVCIEHLPEVRFMYLNNAGKAIEGNLTYSIDGKEKKTVKANEPLAIDFNAMTKGEHTLKVFYPSDAEHEVDSVEQKFVLFSLDDKSPVVDTPDWFYDTVGNYDGMKNFDNGKPIRMQLGTSRQDQTIYYAIVTANSVIEEGAFVLSNANMNRAFTYKEEWGDGIAMRYSWVREGKTYTYSRRFHKPEKDTELKVAWNTFRDKLVPGQQEEWVATVKNPDGTPAKAHMIATVYDKSLDALVTDDWRLHVPYFSFTPTLSSSLRNINTQVTLYGEQLFHPMNEPSLSLYHLDIPEIPSYNQIIIRGYGREDRRMLTGAAKGINMTRNTVFMAKAAAPLDDMSTEETEVGTVAADEEETIDTADIPVRQNLNETATYQWELITDKNGDVRIKFTLPEALTSWRFKGLVHDKAMNNGILGGVAVAQKQLMIQPNMPRFMREGDKGELVSTITNTTDKAIAGNAVMTIISAESDKVVYMQKEKFHVAANKTTDVTFSIPQNLTADMYVVKVVAGSSDFSDGEQQYMPVISAKELVVTTRAITQVRSGQKVIDLNELFGKNTEKERVTVEYTNNPAWLMIDALPAAIQECKDQQNAVSLSTALYAAKLSKHIKSNAHDVELSVDSLQQIIQVTSAQLQTLQNYDGSFSWWPSMPGNAYITSSVVRNLVRLDHLIGTQPENTKLISRAMTYLGKEIAKEVIALKKHDAKKNKAMPSNLAMDYLYLQALRGEKLTASEQADVTYLMNLLNDQSKNLTIYGKANLAVAYGMMKEGGNKQKAKELLESVIQHSVATEDMGRYFDTPKAYYSWRSYKIPTETAAIEALLAVRPNAEQTVAEMRQWLLNEKRTQLWDTPINTTSAIYAFLNGNLSSLDEVEQPAKITLDGKTFFTSGEKKGYFKATEKGRYNKLVFEKKSEGMSFGAVYTEAMQNVADVEMVDDNQLKVTREIIDANGNPITDLTVGQRVKVRITVTAGRDYDFVEVIDNRAACLEPANQMSGYRWGYYTTSGDKKTGYYFNMMPKGKHVIESEYFVDRAGTYQSGLIIARCAYAPEFSARDKAIILKTK